MIIWKSDGTMFKVRRCTARLSEVDMVHPAISIPPTPRNWSSSEEVLEKSSEECWSHFCILSNFPELKYKNLKESLQCRGQSIQETSKKQRFPMVFYRFSTIFPATNPLIHGQKLAETLARGPRPSATTLRCLSTSGFGATRPGVNRWIGLCG